MMKRVNICLVLFIFLYASVIIASSASAEMGVRINAQRGNYNSDLWLKTLTGASSGFESYDMLFKGAPSNYSVLYSSVSGNSLVIDSWNSLDNPRTLSLVYTVSEAQTGDLVLSWNSPSADFSLLLIDCGTASNCPVNISVSDMGIQSSLTVSMAAATNHYFRLAASNLACSQEQISSACFCGETSYSSGYCCAGVYKATSCSETSTDTGASPGGGSPGGGGGSAVRNVNSSISLSPGVLDLTGIIKEVRTSQVEIINTGEIAVDVSITVTGMGGILFVENGTEKFKLQPGEKKRVTLTIASPEKPGVYTGKVLVNEKEVLVTLNVNKNRELLFDVGITIPSRQKSIFAGEILDSQINLIPMAENPRLDITLNYVIKDFEGRTFLSESETMLVEGQKIISKQFHTDNLPAGSYILGLEVDYPNGVATSSAHFEVKEGKPSEGGLFPVLLVVGIILISSAIIIIAIRNRRMNKGLLEK